MSLILLFGIAAVSLLLVTIQVTLSDILRALPSWELVEGEPLQELSTFRPEDEAASRRLIFGMSGWAREEEGR